jgi:hypothetical protein
MFWVGMSYYEDGARGKKSRAWEEVLILQRSSSKKRGDMHERMNYSKARLKKF